MKNSEILLVLALCTACSTPADMRMKKANLEANSKHSAKEIAICITERWQNTKPTLGLYTLPISMTFTKNGYSVIATATGGIGNTMTVALADINDVDTGSTTTYHRDPLGYTPYDSAITECNL